MRANRWLETRCYTRFRDPDEERTNVTEATTLYLDHAATTAVDARVVEAMVPFFTMNYGNPSGSYALARDARRAIDRARDACAEALGCRAAEVIFTSCGSESNNLALKGVAFATRERGRHIVRTAIEHHAILHTVEYLERYAGYEVTIVPVDEYGRLDPDAIGRAIRADTVLVSVMLANNEIGTIQPIREIADVAHGVGSRSTPTPSRARRAST